MKINGKAQTGIELAQSDKRDEIKLKNIQIPPHPNKEAENMNKLLLSALIFLVMSPPVFSFAATKSITVDWSMSDTTNVQSYKMYYSYSSDMAGKVLITTCAPWTEPTPNNFTMTCDNVTISSYPIYFIVTALTTEGDEINSATESVVASVSVVSDFQLLTPSDPTVSAPTSLTCIGYEDSTSCELTSIPPAYYTGSASTTYTRADTLAEGGTLHKIAIYFDAVLPPSESKVVAYKLNSVTGICTLIATGALTPVAKSWTWSEQLITEAGQSLNVASGDTIYFGVFVKGGATSYHVTRTANTGTNDWNIFSSAAPLSTIPQGSWTSYLNNLAAELSYEK
jgi:hypothetical protein